MAGKWKLRRFLLRKMMQIKLTAWNPRDKSVSWAALLKRWIERFLPTTLCLASHATDYLVLAANLKVRVVGHVSTTGFLAARCAVHCPVATNLPVLVVGLSSATRSLPAWTTSHVTMATYFPSCREGRRGTALVFTAHSAADHSEAADFKSWIIWPTNGRSSGFCRHYNPCWNGKQRCHNACQLKHLGEVPGISKKLFWTRLKSVRTDFRFCEAFKSIGRIYSDRCFGINKFKRKVFTETAINELNSFKVHFFSPYRKSTRLKLRLELSPFLNEP